MNVDRLARDIARRLETLPAETLALVQEVVLEELTREQRYRTRELTVESERERREEAEGLREAIDAVNRSLRLDETAEEVLKQVDRLVPADVAELALAGGGGRFRVVGVREGDLFVPGFGRVLPEPLANVLSERRSCMSSSLEGTEGGVCNPGGLMSSMPFWCVLPLIVEGEVVGGLLLGSTSDALDESALHRLRALAFSASAALQRSHRHEQVRLFGVLLEQVIHVYQKAMSGASPTEVARTMLSGALELGNHPAGLLVLGHLIAAVSGFASLGIEGREAPSALHAETPCRLEGESLSAVATELSLPPEATSLYLVPVITGGAQIGTLAVVDPDGDTPDDRLMEAYTSRASVAYQYSAEHARG